MDLRSIDGRSDDLLDLPSLEFNERVDLHDRVLDARRERSDHHDIGRRDDLRRDPRVKHPDRYVDSPPEAERRLHDAYDTDSEPEAWAGDVNPGFVEAVATGDQGRLVNCAECSRAVQSTFEGHPRTAAALEVPWEGSDGSRGEPRELLERWAGRAPEPTTWDGVEDRLRASGGSGIVLAQRDFGGGHAFNVAETAGRIVWIDGQTGDVGDWPPVHLVEGFNDLEVMWFDRPEGKR